MGRRRCKLGLSGARGRTEKKTGVRERTRRGLPKGLEKLHLEFVLLCWRHLAVRQPIVDRHYVEQDVATDLLALPYLLPEPIKETHCAFTPQGLGASVKHQRPCSTVMGLLMGLFDLLMGLFGAFLPQTGF
jgi:hypothetical protein